MVINGFRAFVDQDTLATRSQGKPNMVPKVEGKNVCLRRCYSKMEAGRTMGFAPFERASVSDSSNHHLWGSHPLVLGGADKGVKS